jgi:hypothetical protein
MFHVLNDVSHNISSKLGIYRFSNGNIHSSCYSLQNFLLFLCNCDSSLPELQENY